MRLRNLLTSNARRGEFRAEGDELYLYDVIVADETEAEWFGGVSPRAFRGALASLRGRAVTLRVNSPGGSVFGGEAIAQAIRDHDAPVTAHVDGLAASAASFVAIAAAEVVMAPGAFLMIHRAWSLGMGNAEDMLATAALLEKIDGRIAAAYAERAGEGDADWAALMAAETWFTADEAVAAGLADRIAANGQRAQARAWDLSAFDRAPALDAAPEPQPAAEPCPAQARAALRLQARML